MNIDESQELLNLIEFIVSNNLISFKLDKTISSNLNNCDIEIITKIINEATKTGIKLLIQVNDEMTNLKKNEIILH